ncbi:asparagine synthase (glutamine-hydrolyzing) [Burkholderiales bacterium]|nr:asparagine synthase (glutamine-hydrolyzing) [Burkholderiales bacterium]
MCGIAGYYLSKSKSALTLSSEYRKKSLMEALTTLNHRGPDDSGVYIDNGGDVSLAHSRLSIIDLSSAAKQPMISADGRVVLIFNGEIYNYRELRAELDQGQDIAWTGSSDTEVLLRLYQSARVNGLSYSEFLMKLNGIFSFVIWDSNIKECLVARDGFGVKPLYYSHDELGVAFASEIKALIKLPRSNERLSFNNKSINSQRLDVRSIDRYLTFLWCPGDGTPIPDVKKLEPGHFLRLSNGTIIEQTKWFNLPLPRSKMANRMNGGGNVSKDSTHKNLCHKLEYNLRRAVHRQLVSDVPLGAFLSGGLDSSSIVAFAREKVPDIRCFTIDVEGSQDEGVTNDLPYAKRVAKYLDVPLDIVKLDANRFAADLPLMVDQLDEPLADLSALNVFYISRLAREQGVKVLLSGCGGDDLFTGYRRHTALGYEKYWDWLPQLCLTGLKNLTRRLNQRYALSRRLRKTFSASGLDKDERLINYFRWTDRSDLTSLYSLEFKSALGSSVTEDPMMRFLDNLPEGLTAMERMLFLEQRFFLSDHNLIYTDKMGMAAGVEIRVPFLDMDLAEFSASIPMQFKMQHGQVKVILKKVMENFLPTDIVYRPKTGFGVPLRRWLRGELRELVADTLSRSSIVERGLFDPGAIKRLVVLNDKGKLDASYTLLSIVCIELWCRRFLD